MRVLTLAALLLACCLPPPSPAPAPEPLPPPAPGPAHDAGASLPGAAEACRRYCLVVRRCEPGSWYPDCGRDCQRVVGDRQAAAVSGITPALVRCWATARSCEQARSCDR